MTKRKEMLHAITEECLSAEDEQKLFNNIRKILDSARQKAYTAVNSVMLEAYWNVGRLIVEKQGGAERAAYGDGLIIRLTEKLTTQYGKGFDRTNLSRMRQLYLMFPIVDALRQQLTWTHYRLILKVEDPRAREFYLEECAKGNWSTRQLERQINSFCYERLLTSRDKSGIVEKGNKKEKGAEPFNTIKDPFVLEFLGLDHNTKHFETDLEQALIDNIQNFLLELGRGFTFEARQKRISFDGRHFYIDLVFYNYRMRCFVLIDLKTGDLTHQDIGQMQMYVNYYTRELMNEGDNPPVGIILCMDKSESLIEYTFPEGGNPQIFTSKYKLYLPTEDEFKLMLNDKKQTFLTEKHLCENNGSWRMDLETAQNTSSEQSRIYLFQNV
ncbi:MAG: PDDEXK nuclease domain-containing protein [Methanomassiliicoccaceae archaeon]|nr:PDDEXK nuclease domain-containing protein [Methanomassiliicoccaceae archaeon]